MKYSFKKVEPESRIKPLRAVVSPSVVKGTLSPGGP